MHWDRVVNSASDALFTEEPHDLIPLLNADRVNVIHVADIGGVGGRNDLFHAAQCLVIVGRVRSPKLVSFFQIAQFDPQSGGLNSVHPAVPPNHRMVIFPYLAMVPKDSDFFLQLGIVGDHRAGLTKRTKIFPGVEAETAGVAKCACSSPLVFGSVRLTSVLNDK